MIKHLISTVILALFCALSLSTLAAQEKTEHHKIVIIEKEIGENGEIIEKKIVKEGAEAKAYMEKMEIENGSGSDSKTMKIVKKEAYEIESEDENGQVKILKWNGEGEMPAEMKEIMEKEGMMDELTEGKKHSRIRVKKKNGALEDVMDFEFEGDELPDNVREILEKEGIELEEVVTGEGMREIRVVSKKKHVDDGAGKKAQLGVNIENHPQGVYISNVLPESSAAEGGLQKGDIITGVDGTAMKDIAGLVEKVASYKALDEIKVDFLRDGKAQSSAFVLKEKKELYKFKNWDEVMNMNNGKDAIEIEVDKEIIKEKKK